MTASVNYFHYMFSLYNESEWRLTRSLNLISFVFCGNQSWVNGKIMPTKCDVSLRSTFIALFL